MPPRTFRPWRGSAASGGSRPTAGITYVKVEWRGRTAEQRPDASGQVDALTRAGARIAELEGRIVRRQLHLGFPRAALRHAGDERPLNGVPGETASSRCSTR